MKKVLIIGYFWPYRGGSGRMLGLAKYLAEFGWQPTILTAPLETRPDSKFNFIEIPFSGDIFSFWRKIFSRFGFNTKKSITEQIKYRANISSQKSLVDKIRTFYQEIFAFPDTEKYWRKPALKSARELLNKEKFDAIISVWPVTSHLIAKQLKKDFKLPWVADFPDLWAENYAYPYGKIRKYFDKKLEEKTISETDALTAVSEPLVEILKSSYRNKNIYSILNGFDPDIINKPPALLTKNFTITYTGTIYTDKQDPKKILIAIKNLIDSNKIDPQKIEIRFYGNNQKSLETDINRLKLNSVTKIYGRLTRQESINKQWESQVLLILAWEDETQVGVFPLKIFEYLAARRPILATGGTSNEKLRELIKKTNSGLSAIKIKDIEKAILIYYQEYLKNRKVSYDANLEEVENYSYRSMAKKFAELLNQISKK